MKKIASILKSRKTLLAAGVALNICFLVYTLGFFTPLWELTYDRRTESVVNFYDAAQMFNKILLIFVIFQFIAVAFLYLVRTHVRKRLFTMNYVYLLVYMGFLVVSAFFILAFGAVLLNMFMAADLSVVKQDHFAPNFERSPLVFILGFLIALLQLAYAAGLGLFMLKHKKYSDKVLEERRLARAQKEMEENHG